MQVTIEFQPLKSGDYEKELIISYDTNECVYTRLHGAAQDINVRLDKNSIRIEDTYITMTNQRVVTIHNRSDIIVHYEWKKYATIEEESQQKLKAISLIHREEENSKSKISEENMDYVALLTRNYKNKIKYAQSNSYLFDDEIFFIQPIEGDIWPNSSIDVNIIFKPDYAQVYNRVAFCEVVGRESRLPLRISGVGCGPKVQLSIESLSIGSVFIGSTHIYEVSSPILKWRRFSTCLLCLIMEKQTFNFNLVYLLQLSIIS
jgi:hydrocephalus-inducing protein